MKHSKLFVAALAAACVSTATSCTTQPLPFEQTPAAPASQEAETEPDADPGVMDEPAFEDAIITIWSKTDEMRGIGVPESEIEDLQARTDKRDESMGKRAMFYVTEADKLSEQYASVTENGS